MSNQSPFKWRHFQSEIILLCVRWYLRYSLSYGDLEEMIAQRGLHVDHTTIYRLPCSTMPRTWRSAVDRISAACNDSWKVDETSIKIKKARFYLYRAVASEGTTLEFLLSPTRDAQAAKRFFLKALHSPTGSAPGVRPIEEQVEEPTAPPNPTNSAPRVINVDKNAAYPKAIADLKASGLLPESVELKPGQILEQPDRARPAFSQAVGQACDGLLFRGNSRTNPCRGNEAMHMKRKGQVREVSKGDIAGQVTFIAGLFGAAA